jgi:hypothetical protein
MFHPNVGGLDRILRVTLGAVSFVAGFLLLSGKSSLGVTLAVVGLIALVTGIVRCCALYKPFHISTAPERERWTTQMCCGELISTAPRKRSGGESPTSTEREVVKVG